MWIASYIKWRHRVAIYLATTLFILPLKAFAGAWTQAEDGLLYVNTLAFYTSDAYLDLDGNKTSQPNFNKAESNHYIEYGWQDEWTIGANLFLQYLQQESTTTSGSVTYTHWVDNAGIGDTELFTRYRLKQGAHYVLSLQPLIKLPSYYTKDPLPKGGSDSFDAELSLQAGYSFELWDNHHYLDTRIGYRHRFDNALRDQWKLDIKAGISIAPQWQFIPAIYTTLSHDMPNTATFTESGQNDYHLLKLESSVLYEYSNNLYLQFGGFAHIAGRNTGQGHGLMLSTGYNY